MSLAAKSSFTSLALSLGLSLFTACATGGGTSRVAARVMSLSSGAQDASGVQPVEGAHVAVQCPQGSQVDLGTTSTDGSLRMDASQPIALDCTLTVARAGMKPARMAVGQVCTEQSGTVCRALDVRTVLQPERG